MTAMIDKMARAIWANRRRYLGSWQGQAYISNLELEHAAAEDRKMAYQDARAALTAMLEPNGNMVTAAALAAMMREDDKRIYADSYRSMIQAALDEKEG